MALTKVQSEMAGAGQVLQVVSSISSTVVSNNSTSFVDSGLSATITPKFSTSKIFVSFSQVFFATGAGNTAQILLVRNSTTLVNYGFTGYSGSSTLIYNEASEYLDSPATTSSTTYKIQFNRQSGSNAIISNYTDANGTPVAVMTLMEIAG